MANENANAGASGNEAAGSEQNQNNEQSGGNANQGAAAAAEWVPENLRGHKSLTKFKTAGDVANAYVNLESMMGKRVEIPGADAPEATRTAFWSKMGVPDSPDKYENPVAPEGVEIEFDQDYIGSFKSVAHKVNLTPAQVKELMNWQMAREIKNIADMKAATAKAKADGIAGLRTKWGAAADLNVGYVQRLIAETADPAAKEALDRTGAGNDPAILAWLSRIGSSYAEHDLMDAKDLGTTVSQAQAEIDKVLAEARKDRKHPYNDSAHPEHKRVKEQMASWYSIAFPDVPFEIA